MRCRGMPLSRAPTTRQPPVPQAPKSRPPRSCPHQVQPTARSRNFSRELQPESSPGSLESFPPDHFGEIRPFGGKIRRHIRSTAQNSAVSRYAVQLTSTLRKFRCRLSSTQPSGHLRQSRRPHPNESPAAAAANKAGHANEMHCPKSRLNCPHLKVGGPGLTRTTRRSSALPAFASISQQPAVGK
jgi:hypothetical protein